MNLTSPVLSAHQVSRKFGKKTVLENISLEIRPAETYGLLGPSGSGKTTLVKMLAGLDEATSGEVYLFGNKMPQLKLMQQIGYMAQADALYGELSARENMQLFASLYGLKGNKCKERIEATAELVDLSEHLNKRVHNFSGGMKRRLSLAITLLHQPPLLLLDEPTVGIDPVLRKSIWKELKELNAQGTTIVMTTHVMDEVEKCDRIAMIRDGGIIAEGSPEALIQETGTNTIEEAFISYGGRHK